MTSFYKYTDCFHKPLKPLILLTRDNILTAKSISTTTSHSNVPASEIVLTFITKLILAQKFENIHPILTSLFEVQEFTPTEEEKQILELFWHAFPALERPTNTPWPHWDSARVQEVKQRFDPESMEFFIADERQLGNTDWVVQQLNLDITPAYDPHQWKTSSDEPTLIICARLLLWPEDGQPPARTKIEEAFSAVEKLFTMKQSVGERLDRNLLSLKVYFVLAMYLEKTERAWEVLRLACSEKEMQGWDTKIREPSATFQLEELLELPALYEMLAAASETPVVEVDDEDIELAQMEWCKALEERAKKGKQEALQDVPMAELLRRFSEAAFFVHMHKYVEEGVSSPEEILEPPITVEQLAELEERLDELPDDVKELASIANGFKGGWHFAAGGWPSLSNMWKEPAADHEIYLGYFPAPVQTKKRKVGEDGQEYEVTVCTINIGAADSGSGKDFGSVYVGPGTVECDDFMHVLCPASTWKKIQEAQGKQAEAGEYQYVSYAHWTGGGDKMFPSVRAWVAGMTLDLERRVALGEQIGKDESEDEDDGDD